MKSRLATLCCALGLAGLTSLPCQAAPVETSGFLKFECWFPPLRVPGHVGTAVSSLWEDPNFSSVPPQPDLTSYMAGLNSRSVFPDDSHEQHGAQMTGWITPKVTGYYYLYLDSDDASELWLSPDADPLNAQYVAAETGCCKGFLDPNPSEPFNSPPQTSAPIPMTAGQKYAIKILWKEGEVGDYLRVAMQLTNSTIPAKSLQPLSGTMLSSMADPAGASLSITQQPVNTTTAENAPAVTFSVAATAVTPFGQYTGASYPSTTNSLAAVMGTKTQLPTLYQWFTNGVEVAGANSTNLTLTWPKKAQDGMKVKCYVAVPGIPMYSSEATLTVTADTTAPTVVKAVADATFTNVVVKFSEPVSDTALQASRYGMDQGVTVTSIERVDLTTVTLHTSRMADSKTYTLTINGVQDTATSPNTIANNTQVTFKSFVFVPGMALRTKYKGPFDNGAGANIANLFNSPQYPTSPSRVDVVPRMEYPNNGIDREPTEVGPYPAPLADKLFFDTIEGWFTPPVTTNYVFFTAFADRCWMYLSTDESPANKYLIMSPSGWADPRGWNNSHGGGSTSFNPDIARSDRTTATQWPSGNTITLQAGKRYYMMLAHHMPDWAGGHFFAATYTYEGETEPAVGTAPKLAGSIIGTYLDPTIGSVSFTLQPTNITAASGTRVTFYATATGSSPYTTNVTYQWQSAPKNSSTWSDIAGATGASYTTDYIGGADNGKQFRVIASAVPASTISSVAVLSVLVDNTPPTVVKVWTDMSWNTVTVRFSEPVSDATALQIGRYTITPGVTVTSVTRVDSLTVKLTTSKLNENQVYTLSVTGVQDTAVPPNTIAPNTQAEVRSLVFVSGAVLHQKYTNVDMGTGSSPAGLFNDPRFPNNPDRRDIMRMWEYPANGLWRDLAVEPDGTQYRLYFDTIEGYFIPPVTTNYVLYMCGADRFWLYLSTDESPANKHLICAQPGGWTNPRNWMTRQGSTDNTPHRSDQFTGTEWPTGNTITLEAGKRYYMLLMHHDTLGAGADDFAATFKMEGEPDPKDGDAPRLTGSLVGYYFDPSGATVNFTQQPQSTSVVEGQTATFTAAATGSSAYGTTVSLQWQSAPKNSSTWTDIPGATAATYRTPTLGVADDGKQFRIIASVPPYSLASSVATLTVQADTTPPVPTVGAMLDDTAGIVDVGVGFDETVDEVSGTTLANYSVSSGTITSISWQTNRFTANSQNPAAMIRKQTALLKVTGLTGTSGTLTIRNVADAKGNRITSVTLPFTVDTKMKWGVVGANEFGSWNAVVPVAANGWDIYSDGFGAWAVYDESTFLYEQVTGDFDKKVRVAYQDGSSQWARAGLIAKEALGFGADRANQTNTAIRYQKCLVYPVGATLQGPGTAGSQSWDLNRRLDVGGATTGATRTGPNAIPQYPNAWCRLKRVGQTFSMYRSDDGVNWVLLGSTTWGVEDTSKTPMPATLYVGPDFAPEIGNITLAEDRGTFLAQFRDYGDYSAVFNPLLKIAPSANGKVTITWTTGTLVSSPTVNGTYTPVTGATSGMSITPTATTFYRIQQ